MSEHHLGDDVARWPDDPHEVLGVAHGVSARDLRRAYTRLIRSYKPEQYPEHFKRIRDAYESLRMYAEMFSQHQLELLPQPSAEEPTLREGEPANEPETGAGPPVERSMSEALGTSSTPPPDSLEAMLEDLWERACTGAVEAAYFGLRNLYERHAGSPAVCFRLYWLLFAHPDLDPSRAPTEWLTDGLRASGMEGGLRELYRREIEASPAEALTERCTQLLECPVRAGLIADIAGWRWQAAGRLQRWDVIAQDVELLRERVSREDEETWVRLLLSAIDQLAWSPDLEWHAAGRRYAQEIERLDHLAFSLGFELDRLEFLIHLSSSWHNLKVANYLPDARVHLIPLSWTRPLSEARPSLLIFLRWIATHPPKALSSFDSLQVHSPPVLAQFGKILDQFSWEVSTPDEPSDSEAATALIHGLLASLDGFASLDYNQDRARLLSFCLEEWISPEWMAQVVADCPWSQRAANEHFSQCLLDDWPMRYVVQAHRLFWA